MCSFQRPNLFATLHSFWWALEKCRDCRVWLAALRRKRWNLWNGGSLRQSSMSECYAESLWGGIVQNISPLKHKPQAAGACSQPCPSWTRLGACDGCLGLCLVFSQLMEKGVGLTAERAFYCLLPVQRVDIQTPQCQKRRKLLVSTTTNSVSTGGLGLGLAFSQAFSTLCRPKKAACPGRLASSRGRVQTAARAWYDFVTLRRI